MLSRNGLCTPCDWEWKHEIKFINKSELTPPNGTCPICIDETKQVFVAYNCGHTICAECGGKPKVLHDEDVRRYSPPEATDFGRPKTNGDFDDEAIENYDDYDTEDEDNVENDDGEESQEAREAREVREARDAAYEEWWRSPQAAQYQLAYENWSKLIKARYIMGKAALARCPICRTESPFVPRVIDLTLVDP